MPPLNYRVLHPSAYLSRVERTAIERWIDAQTFGNQAQMSPHQVSK